jgi:hypothetical protein
VVPSGNGTRTTVGEIDLTLENRPNDWAWEFAFWHSVKIVHR